MKYSILDMSQNNVLFQAQSFKSLDNMCKKKKKKENMKYSALKTICKFVVGVSNVGIRSIKAVSSIFQISFFGPKSLPSKDISYVY